MVSVLAHEEIVQVNSGRAVTPPILKGKPEGRHVLWHIADPVDDRMNGSSVTGEDSEGVAPACSRIIALVERGRRRLFAEAARRPPLRFGPSKRQKGGVKTILRIWATPSAAPQRWNGRQAANSSRRSEDQLGGQSQFARAAYDRRSCRLEWRQQFVIDVEHATFGAAIARDYVPAAAVAVLGDRLTLGLKRLGGSTPRRSFDKGTSADKART
jgi:hypothetical protein